MSHTVNFGDNIFFLTMKVRTLKNSLKLDIDSDLFLETINKEIIFIMLTLDKIFEFLKESSLIIDKLENLKNVQRLKLQLIHLLSGILEGKSSFSSFMKSNFGEFRKMRDECQQNIEEIKSMITGISEKAVEDRYIISEQEYRHLLSDEE
jgi:hypothetical protein